jgi:2',3'-cyclic-nucleotide 2'-phosphodiesterase (5'-nucleotidase family)
MDISLKIIKALPVFVSILICTYATAKTPHKVNVVFAASMNEINLNIRNGYAPIAHLLKEQRKSDIPTFFFFGGASIGPSMLSTFDLGSHIIDLLNEIEPDAMAIAKRDFSYLEDELILRSYEAAFPFVSTNLIDKRRKTSLDGLNPYFIAKQGPYEIGVLSTLSSRAIEEYNLRNISIIDDTEIIKQYASELRLQGVDLVALIDTGFEGDTTKLLDKGIVDVVFTKDSSAAFRTDQVIKKHPRMVFIKNVDDIALTTLTWSTPDDLSVNTTFYEYANLPNDEKMQARLADYKIRLDNLLNEPIAAVNVTFNTRSIFIRKQESLFGNLVTDAMKKHTGADIALINSGTIRGQSFYKEGQSISRKNVLLELPYRNNIVLLNVSGQELRLAIEHGLSGMDKILGLYLQVSGLEVTYNSNNEIGQRVVSLKHKNKEVENTTHYKVALTEYLAKGGDNYQVFAHHEKVFFNKKNYSLLSDVVINYIRDLHVVSPTLGKRLIDIAAMDTAEND